METRVQNAHPSDPEGHPPSLWNLPWTLSCLKWLPPLKFQSFSLVLVPYLHLSSQMEAKFPKGLIHIREGFLYSRQAPGRISLQSIIRSVPMTWLTSLSKDVIILQFLGYCSSVALEILNFAVTFCHISYKNDDLLSFLKLMMSRYQKWAGANLLEWGVVCKLDDMFHMSYPSEM